VPAAKVFFLSVPIYVLFETSNSAASTSSTRDCRTTSTFSRRKKNNVRVQKKRRSRMVR